MNYKEMRSAVESAKDTMRLADLAMEDLVQLVKGRLRHVTSYRGIEALKQIKKELSDFDARKGEWKS